MLKFSSLGSNAICIIVVIPWNLAIIVWSKSIPFRSIQRIEFHCMDSVYRFSRSYCCYAISPRDNTYKDILQSVYERRCERLPSSISIRPRLPYTSILLRSLYSLRSWTSFQGRNSTTHRLLLSSSLDACRNIRAYGSAPAPRRAIDRGSC